MPNVELTGEPGTGVAEDIIGRLLPEWWSRFQPKNKAYGGELARGGGLGIKAFIPEMNRKMGGIINQIWHGEKPPQGAEDAREKAMDLIGHLFILISNLDAKQDSGPRTNFDMVAVMDRAVGASRAARLSGGDGKAAGIAKVDELANLVGRTLTREEGHTPYSSSKPLAGFVATGDPDVYARPAANPMRVRTEAELRAERWSSGETAAEDEDELPLAVKQCPDTRSHHPHDWRTPRVGIEVRCNGYTAPF